MESNPVQRMHRNAVPMGGEQQLQPTDQTVNELLRSGSFKSVSAKWNCPVQSWGWHTTWQSTQNSIQSIHEEVAEGQTDSGTWAVVSLSLGKRTGRGFKTSDGSPVLPEELGSTIYSPQLKLVLTSHLSDKETNKAKGTRERVGNKFKL